MALITGTVAAEVLTGTEFDDSIRGGAGSDTILGGLGDDLLEGEDGNDRLDGGGGDDSLAGGAGADVFALASIDGSSDVLLDFDADEGDTLEIDGELLADLDFELEVVDTDGDGDMDTVLTLEGNTEWSVTLEDVDDLDEDDDDDDVEPPPPTGVTLTGTAGDDTLAGGAGNDTLRGLEGDDVLDGAAGDDRQEGGEGDDTMTGGDGADDFVFEFGMEVVPGGTSSFAAWRAEMGLPALVDGTTTQGEFSSSYSQWLEHLVDTFSLGIDVDLDGEVEVDLNQNDEDGTPAIEGMTETELDAMFGERDSLVVKTGNTTHTRWFSDSFEIADREIFTGEGADVITDFSAAEGDRIVVSGIPEELVGEFHMRITDLDGDGAMDTEFCVDTDCTWSVQLMGVAGFDVSDSVVVAA
jgi:Ca2+-binding RTX toxin-like protein